MLPQRHVLFEQRNFFSSGLLFLVGWLSTLASRGDRIRAEHRTVYGIRPYPYGANTVTGMTVTVTVQWPEISETVRYGCEDGRIRGHMGLYGCD